MNLRNDLKWAVLAVVSVVATSSACSSTDGEGGNTGGSSTGGATGSAGKAGAGNTSSGGSGSSGTAGQGSSTGGASSGGSAGKASTGGASGGSATGGAGGVTGGAGGSNAGAGGTNAGGAGGASNRLCKPGGTGFDTTLDGVALDLKTCLEWQRQSPPKQPGSCATGADNPDGYCWTEASNACKALRTAGQSDWRLPTVTELQSIVVKGVQPSIDSRIFPNTAASMYWTSETHGEKPSPKATCLDFYNDGMANPNIGQTGGQAYRCVRGPLKGAH